MVELIIRLIGRGGAAAVFALMLVENIVPPIPSELILPLAGYAAARGEMDFTAAVLAGTAGSVLGAWLWFEAGLRLGERRLLDLAGRHGRWLAVTPAELTRSLAWIRRRGGAAVLVGRMLPGVRGVICLPAGLAGIGRGAFLMWCSLGSFGWSLLLCGAGALLRARYREVDRWLGPVGLAVLALFAVAYLVRVVTWKPEAGRSGRRQLADAGMDDPH